MASLKAVTPAEALAIWKRMKSPSARSVARALSQSSRKVHFSTVARWRAQGWRPVARGPHPVEAAREALDIAARLFTGDPAIGAEIFARQSETSEQSGDLSDRELLRQATRDLLMLQILLGQAACDCGVFLLQEKVAETAVHYDNERHRISNLVDAFWASSDAGNLATDPTRSSQDCQIGVRPLAPSPSRCRTSEVVVLAVAAPPLD